MNRTVALAVALVCVLLAVVVSAHAEEHWPELDPPRRERVPDLSAQQALEAARPELVRCLEGTPHTHLVVQVRLSPRYPLSVRVRPLRLDPAVRQCAELAAERHLFSLASRAPVRFSIGRVEVPAADFLPPPRSGRGPG